MEFLDEDPLETSGASTGPPHRGAGADRRRQIVLRRLIALGLSILLLVLIVIGIKGCLNARKERGFENYTSDLGSAVAQTNQLSSDFFGLLNDPGKLSELSYETQINSYAGTAGGLLNTVQGIGTPDELKDDQSQIVLAYEMRQEGLSGIADNMKNALGTGPTHQEAIAAITDDMSELLASDVLYARAKADIDTVLSDQGIEVNGKPAKAPDSVFMPDPQRWLDPLQVAIALAKVGGQATSGTHGLALLQTSLKPGDVVLSPDTPTTVSAGGQPEVDVQVSNQGDQDEQNVGVSFEITGGPQTINGEATIPRIVAGGTQTAPIPIKPAPPSGQEVTLTVTILPVPGETLTTNNTSTYQVTFGGGSTP